MTKDPSGATSGCFSDAGSTPAVVPELSASMGTGQASRGAGLHTRVSVPAQYCWQSPGRLRAGVQVPQPIQSSTALLDRTEMKITAKSEKMFMHLCPGQIWFLVLPNRQWSHFFSLVFSSKGSNKPLLDVLANVMPANLMISVPSGILLQIHPSILIAAGISLHSVIQPSKSRRKTKRIKVSFHCI